MAMGDMGWLVTLGAHFARSRHEKSFFQMCHVEAFPALHRGRLVGHVCGDGRWDIAAGDTSVYADILKGELLWKLQNKR